MAPKSQTATSSIPLIIPKEINFLTISSDTEANPSYKCFARFVNTSYLRKALTMSLPMYVDILEGFWRTDVVTVMAREDGTSFQELEASSYSLVRRKSTKLWVLRLRVMMQKLLMMKWWTS